jgi:hypothetical protein
MNFGPNLRPAPAWTKLQNHPLFIIGRGAEFFVAQICNLLYRRIAFGRPLAFPTPTPIAAAGGLQIRDTAEFNSALRVEEFCPHPL